jgi:hypothetical protein
MWHNAKPNKTAMTSTGRRSPWATAPTRFDGIIFIRKSTIVNDWALDT